MATLDLRRQRVCVRVVYDGIAGAGKTTNVQKLAEVFATQRASEKWDAPEAFGRTLYFDWLEIAAGMICGFPLLCQVITVPGQVVLTPRRRHLLSTADVVVHVVESDPRHAARAARGAKVLEETLVGQSRVVPVVVQANKQDKPKAMAGPAVLRLLGRDSLPVVEAIASEGVGVVDTFIAAVRAVVRSVQAESDAGAFRLRVARTETADSLLAKVSTEQVDPDWAFEMLLEDAANAFLLEGTVDIVGPAIAAEVTAEAHGPEEPELEVPSVSRASVSPPTLPTDAVPTGFIWPAHTGRATLRSLAGEAARASLSVADDGRYQLALRGFSLGTHARDRYATAELARGALVRAARERSQLGSLLPPETVLVAQPGAEGETWIWTVLPRAPSFAERLRHRDDPAAKEAWRAYGDGLAAAVAVEIAHDLPLDLSAACFALRQGSVRYLGDVPSSRAPGDPGRALLDTLACLSPSPEQADVVLTALEQGLRSRLAAEQARRLVKGPSWMVSAAPWTRDRMLAAVSTRSHLTTASG